MRISMWFVDARIEMQGEQEIHKEAVASVCEREIEREKVWKVV